MSRPLAWCPGLSARSPCGRGALFAPTDSETERRCRVAPRQRAIGSPGAGRGRQGGDVGDAKPWKSSRFVQVSPGKARCEAEQRVPLPRRRALGGAGWRPRAAAGWLSPSSSYYAYGQEARVGGQGRKGSGSGHWSAFPPPSILQVPSPWGSRCLPRHPCPSRGADARPGGAEPACVQPRPWSRLERARWSPAASSVKEQATGHPPRAFLPGGRVGWWRPASLVSALHGNFSFPRWIKVAWIFLFLCERNHSCARNLGFLRWSCCRALGGRKPRCPCGVTTEIEAIGAWAGHLHPPASLDSSWAARLGDPALGSRQPPRRRWPLGPGTARAAPPSPHRSCRGHQPGRWRLLPPRAAPLPAPRVYVTGGAWADPPLKVSPNCTPGPLEPQQRPRGAKAILSWR